MNQLLGANEIELIHEALQSFGIRGTLKIKGGPYGYTGRVFRVYSDTEDKDYAVHLSSGIDKAVVENTIVIARQLATASLRAAPVLVGKDEKPFFERNGFVAVVYPWVNGRHPEAYHVSQLECNILGRSLALFHTSLKSLPYANERQLLLDDFQDWWKTAESFKGLNGVHDLMDIAKTYRSGELPRGIVHGDFHADNVLLSKDGVAVLDTERSGEGVLLLDIARAVLDVCSDGAGFSLVKNGAFVEGYESVRRLSSEERDMYRPAVAYAALAVSRWFQDIGRMEVCERFLNIGKSAITQLR